MFEHITGVTASMDYGKENLLRQDTLKKKVKNWKRGGQKSRSSLPAVGLE